MYVKMEFMDNLFKKKVLFVCTSNKDRSPALEKYFRELYPHNDYSSAGINEYFCKKKGTKYITAYAIAKADILVFAEDVHFIVTAKNFTESFNNNGYKQIICLNLGDYEQGNINDKYLLHADLKVGEVLRGTKNEQL